MNKFTNFINTFSSIVIDLEPSSFFDEYRKTKYDKSSGETKEEFNQSIDIKALIWNVLHQSVTIGIDNTQESKVIFVVMVKYICLFIEIERLENGELSCLIMDAPKSMKYAVSFDGEVIFVASETREVWQSINKHLLNEYDLDSLESPTSFLKQHYKIEACFEE